MINPSMRSLLEKVNNRFMLCIITGKRARQLVDGAQKLTSTVTTNNSVTIAINEINEAKVICAKN